MVIQTVLLGSINPDGFTKRADYTDGTQDDFTQCMSTLVPIFKFNI